jgi:hypothetical protein
MTYVSCHQVSTLCYPQLPRWKDGLPVLVDASRDMVVVNSVVRNELYTR